MSDKLNTYVFQLQKSTLLAKTDLKNEKFNILATLKPDKPLLNISEMESVQMMSFYVQDVHVHWTFAFLQLLTLAKTF